MNQEELIAAVREAIRGKDVSPPASNDAVVAAETVIGYQFPPLLRTLFLEVANGGFGPRRGILGVEGMKDRGGDWANLVDVYKVFTIEANELPPGMHPFPESIPPLGLVWLFDWGDNTWTLIDCRDESGLIWEWDATDFLQPTEMTFADWLESWLNGTLSLDPTE